jgi:hypothetical protein
VLEHTFVHIQGIGPKTERTLWARGIRTWHDYLAHPTPLVSASRDRLVRDELERSLENLGNVDYFNRRLQARESWRLFEAFRPATVYLDIETSGGYEGYDEITVIGLYDGVRTQTFVSGANLDAFEIAVAEYDVVVTFNGACFDLPYIRHAFPGITLPAAHIDLRFVLRRLGLSGGLKAIERRMGLAREEGVDGMNGLDAVRLWAEHLNGDPLALDRLIRYNTADIVNLEPLMETGFRWLMEALLRGRTL